MHQKQPELWCKRWHNVDDDDEDDDDKDEDKRTRASQLLVDKKDGIGYYTYAILYTLAMHMT